MNNEYWQNFNKTGYRALEQFLCHIKRLFNFSWDFLFRKHLPDTRYCLQDQVR